MNLSTSTLDAARRAYLAGSANPLKPGRMSDGRNLYLSIAPTGAMSWVFIQMVNGKSREIGVGSFTGAGRAVALSLKDARLQADAIRMELAQGRDPLAERRAAKQQATRAVVTFEQVLAEKIAALRSDWKGSENEAQWLSSISQHARSLLAKSIASISLDDVLAVLRPIWKTIAVTAERVRYRIEQVLNLAKTKGLRDGDNPAAYAIIKDVLGARPTKKTAKAKGEEKGHLALSYAELPAFMGRLLKATGNGAKALALCIMTATRTDEARLMQWSEVDLDKGLWTIPALRMKAGVEHVVPLSTQAVALLRSLDRVEGNPFVFAGSKEGAALGETALSDKLTKGSAKGGLGYAGKATVHGFRSTFSDWVGDCTTFAKEDREFCLAHGLDAVEGSYRRSTAVEKRRAIMQSWANFAHGTANVVALKVAA